MLWRAFDHWWVAWPSLSSLWHHAAIQLPSSCIACVTADSDFSVRCRLQGSYTSKVVYSELVAWSIEDSRENESETASRNLEYRQPSGNIAWGAAVDQSLAAIVSSRHCFPAHVTIWCSDKVILLRLSYLCTDMSYSDQMFKPLACLILTVFRNCRFPRILGYPATWNKPLRLPDVKVCSTVWWPMQNTFWSVHSTTCMWHEIVVFCLTFESFAAKCSVSVAERLLR